MKKENVIDFAAYRNQQNTSEPKTQKPISQELETEIKNLIQRLRELGPLKSSQ